MTKTLREIYKTTDFWGILDAIEERLSEGNLQKEHLALMLALQNDWNNATRIISERHSHRLCALESRLCADVINKAKARIAKYNSDDRLGEILEQIKSESALDHLEPGKREWLPYSPVWCYYESEGIMVINVVDMSAVSEGDMWMPYHPGDQKPEPPVDNELRGA